MLISRYCPFEFPVYLIRLITSYANFEFFTALRTEEVIPIALGGATIDDYKKAAPPMSYIHVNEYSTVAELAEKLEYLSNNETAYNEYFWWTEHYRVSSLWDHYVSAQCDLCEKMNIKMTKWDILETSKKQDFSEILDHLEQALLVAGCSTVDPNTMP